MPTGDESKTSSEPVRLLGNPVVSAYPYTRLGVNCVKDFRQQTEAAVNGLATKLGSALHYPLIFLSVSERLIIGRGRISNGLYIASWLTSGLAIGLITFLARETIGTAGGAANGVLHLATAKGLNGKDYAEFKSAVTFLALNAHLIDHQALDRFMATCVLTYRAHPSLRQSDASKELESILLYKGSRLDKLHALLSYLCVDPQGHSDNINRNFYNVIRKLLCEYHQQNKFSISAELKALPELNTLVCNLSGAVGKERLIKQAVKINPDAPFNGDTAIYCLEQIQALPKNELGLICFERADGLVIQLDPEQQKLWCIVDAECKVKQQEVDEFRQAHGLDNKDISLNLIQFSGDSQLQAHQQRVQGLLSQLRANKLEPEFCSNLVADVLHNYNEKISFLSRQSAASKTCIDGMKDANRSPSQKLELALLYVCLDTEGLNENSNTRLYKIITDELLAYSDQDLRDHARSKNCPKHKY